MNTSTRHFVSALALSTALASVGSARADSPASSKAGSVEEQKPVKGTAPVDPPKTPVTEKEKPKPGNVFDASAFGEPDKATEALLKTVDEKCYASPMSREGMSPAEERRCNLAVAKVVQHGMAAVPGILAKLNDTGEGSLEHYYARSRLYYVLAKTDDPRVEDVLIRGYARIATQKLDDYVGEASSIDAALVAMNGSNPVEAEHLGREAVEDNWQDAQNSVISWRIWQKNHAKKAKAELRNEALKQARIDKSSPDVKKQYIAASTLAEQAPTEALKMITKVEEREDLTDAQKQPFYNLESRAFENGGKAPVDDRN